MVEKILEGWVPQTKTKEVFLQALLKIFIQEVCILVAKIPVFSLNIWRVLQMKTYRFFLHTSQ